MSSNTALVEAIIGFYGHNIEPARRVELAEMVAQHTAESAKPSPALADVIEWLAKRPGASWFATVKDMAEAVRYMGGEAPSLKGFRSDDIVSGAMEWAAQLRREASPVPETAWRAIETAPTDGTHVVVMNEPWFRRTGVATVAHYFEGGWHLSVNHDGEHSEYGTPTHWMPIPAFGTPPSSPDTTSEDTP